MAQTMGFWCWICHKTSRTKTPSLTVYSIKDLKFPIPSQKALFGIHRSHEKSTNSEAGSPSIMSPTRAMSPSPIYQDHRYGSSMLIHRHGLSLASPWPILGIRLIDQVRWPIVMHQLWIGALYSRAMCSSDLTMTIQTIQCRASLNVCQPAEQCMNPANIVRLVEEGALQLDTMTSY